MKKILGIVVLALLWCNIVNAGLKQPGPGEDNDISCITGALDAYKEAQEYLIKNPKKNAVVYMSCSSGRWQWNWRAGKKLKSIHKKSFKECTKYSKKAGTGECFLFSTNDEINWKLNDYTKKVVNKTLNEKKQIILRRTNGYHGTNFGGTSAQGIAPNREGWGDLVPHFLEIPNNDIEAAASVFSNHGSEIAAMIVEPIQGAGGVYPPVDGYLEGIRKLCDDNDALLIFDEVICGFGRTGKWFGAQHFGVTPDLMTFAKGVTSGYLPLSGVIVSRNVCDTLEEPDFILRTGYTYSGHPTSCAAGIANLELMESEALVDRANHVGEQIRTGLESLQSDGLVESWRGTGAVSVSYTHLTLPTICSV